MQWWMWFVAAVGLLLVEVLTPGGFYFVFFGVGAVAAGLLALIGVESLLVQALVFLVVSVGAVAMFRKPLLARFQTKNPKRVVDSMVGETAILGAELHPGQFGHAELRGASWTVRNIGSLPIPAGQRCIVEQVEGLTLNVRAAQ